MAATLAASQRSLFFRAMPDQPYLWGHANGPIVDRSVARAHLIAADPALARIIARVGDCQLAAPPQATTFQYLLKAIVYQQLSGKAASTIFGRVGAIFTPRSRVTPAALLATPPARLRAAGLSQAKTLAVLDLARHARIGRLPGLDRLRGMDAEAIIEQLTVVRGVGRWTAEMLLIFHLGHPDILPLNDLGVLKGFARTVGRRRRGLPSPKTLARHGDRWRPYRSVASWYLWRALELPPE